jgi:hypothetical protein
LGTTGTLPQVATPLNLRFPGRTCCFFFLWSYFPDGSKKKYWFFGLFSILLVITMEQWLLSF